MAGAGLLAAAYAAMLLPVPGTAHAATAGRQVALPPVAAQVSYQIGGAFAPASGVGVVDRDWRDAPAAGRYSICYVNGFQTQPEQARWWKQQHPALLLRDAHGRPVEDPGWPGEFLLDTASAAHRRAVARIVGGWMRTCASKGFAATEPDNLDSWSRSHHLLTRADNLALARLLVDRAHALGLAVAQKNAVEIARTGHDDVGFDFAIAEECQVYAECGGYLQAYGRHVIEIEYTDNPQRYFDAACRARGSRISVLLRDRDVKPRGRTGYVERWCG